MRSRCFRAIKSACGQVGPLVGACYDRVINVPRKSYRVASFEFVIFFRMDPRLPPPPLLSASRSVPFLLVNGAPKPDNKNGRNRAPVNDSDPQEALAVKASKILARSP